MKLLDIKPDIDFYNILIKNRCLSMSKISLKEKVNFARNDTHTTKKLRLNYNIMTYGVLALACNTLMSAEQLLNEMKEKSLKINIEILGTLLKHGVVQTNFDYIIYVLEVTRGRKKYSAERQNIIIKEPKKFYKPKHKFYVPYVPKL
ncbi:hypothetical protein ACJJTC_016083 [Scirpophaga incertulas]